MHEETFEVFSRVKFKNQKSIAVDVLFKAHLMVPISRVDPIWPDGTFKKLLYIQVLPGSVRYCQELSGAVRYCQELLGAVRRCQVRGVLGNKCAGHHNLKTVKIREIT